MSGTTVIKEGMMSKRSQGKNAFSVSRPNWRERFFVLVPGELTYWEGYGGPKNADAKRKGVVPMAEVHAVEEVPRETFNRDYMIQVVYSNYVLYAQAPDQTERESWIKFLREQTKRNGDGLHKQYHPGCVESGKWSCCGAAKSVHGCKDVTMEAPMSRTQSDPINGSTAKEDDPHRPSLGGADSGVLADAPEESPSSPPAPGPVVQPDAGFEVFAVHAYNASEAHDLSISQGESLFILDCKEEHWWQAQNKQGKVGYIPSNYVRKMGLESEPWFQGKMSRSDAANLLRVAKSEGCFLVRESESKPGEYSLSVSHGDSLRHYHVKRAGVDYYINERHVFPSVTKLIEYHKLNAGGLVTRLRKSVGEIDAPITAGLGHAKWEIDPTDISIGRELGSGQFGIVKEGLYKGNRKVAVKMMKKDAMSEDEFIAEAQVMKNFNHTNLVQLYGVCTKQRPIYIVTEFMTNGCLLDYLRDNQWLSTKPEIIHYMSVQVCSAMVFLEQRLFIHRDLAARNCLIGEKNQVKVCDFGLARFVLDDEYTASEGTKFPIKWAAPEVISFARFSTKSDVWSYGILLWELWSIGRTPYPSLSNIEVVDKVVEGYRLPRPQLASALMHQLMLDSWHHDPEYRPTFVELKLRLEENKTAYVEISEEDM